MLQVSFIFAVIFVFLSFPEVNSRGLSIKKESEINNHSSINVNLHLNSVHKKNIVHSDAAKYNQVQPHEKNLELPVEYFADAPLPMESWMKSPIKRSNSKD